MIQVHHNFPHLTADLVYNQGLYVGGYKIAVNEKFLKDEIITMIISCAAEIPLDQALCDRLNITGLHWPLEDRADERDALSAHLVQYCGVVQRELASGGRVLLHCAAGVSRSVAVAIGFLMLERGKSLGEAYAMVKERRPCIAPNAGFLLALAALDE